MSWQCHMFLTERHRKITKSSRASTLPEKVVGKREVQDLGDMASDQFGKPWHTVPEIDAERQKHLAPGHFRSVWVIGRG